ncbi:MAG: FAD/NAD(P)-binding oxidoreductase [Gemmatimonadaceae bacterium]
MAVVGAGPAGIAAAVTAAGAGARTIVLDEGTGPGGQIWRPSVKVGQPSRASAWIERLGRSSATVLRSTSVVTAHAADDRFVLRGESTEGAVEIVCRRVVLATGAHELFLPFPGWTLPNVFGIGGAQALLKSGLNVRGRRVVISGSGPLLFPVAASLAKAGAELVLVAEQATRAAVVSYVASLWRRPSTLVQAASLRASFIGARYQTGTWVSHAHGDDVLRGVVVADGKRTRMVDCDMLCTGFGLVPNNELARLLGCAMHGRFAIVDDTQATSTSGVYTAGETTGIGGVDAALVEGEIAGAAAAGARPSAALLARRNRLARDAELLARTFAPRAEIKCLAKPETIVCRCEDTTLGELDGRWTARQAKLYTRAGMGPCQGRVCGAALECVMGWPSDTVRSPVQPARLSTLTADFSAASKPSSTE